jgi:hypothetical protein
LFKESEMARIMALCGVVLALSLVTSCWSDKGTWYVNGHGDAKVEGVFNGVPYTKIYPAGTWHLDKDGVPAPN